MIVPEPIEGSFEASDSAAKRSDLLSGMARNLRVVRTQIGWYVGWNHLENFDFP